MCECAFDNVDVGHVCGIWVVLDVEGGGAQDEGREDLGERLSRDGHDEGEFGSFAAIDYVNRGERCSSLDRRRGSKGRRVVQVGAKSDAENLVAMIAVNGKVTEKPKLNGQWGLRSFIKKQL